MSKPEDIRELTGEQVRLALKIEARSGYDLVARRADFALMLRFEDGSGRLELEPGQPIIRAFRAALVQGRPTEIWRVLLVKVPNNEKARIVGTFVRSRGDRILYFPATGVRLGRGVQGSTEFLGSFVDHLTMDPPRSGARHSSHITVIPSSPAQKTHGWRFARRAQEDLAYWFTMLSNGVEHLPLVPAMVTSRFSSGRPDVTERAAELASGGGGAMIPLPDECDHPSFIQMDVWVGRGPGWGITGIEALPYLGQTDLVTDVPPGEQTTRAAAVTLMLGDQVGVIVVFYRLRGRLLRTALLKAKLKTK